MYRDQFGEFVCGYWDLLKISPAARNKPVFVQAMNSTEDKLIICYCTILTTQGLKKKKRKYDHITICKKMGVHFHHHHCHYLHCHCRNHYSDHHQSFVFTCGITSINSIAANNNIITIPSLSLSLPPLLTPPPSHHQSNSIIIIIIISVLIISSTAPYITNIIITVLLPPTTSSPSQ